MKLDADFGIEIHRRPVDLYGIRLNEKIGSLSADTGINGIVEGRLDDPEAEEQGPCAGNGVVHLPGRSAAPLDRLPIRIEQHLARYGGSPLDVEVIRDIAGEELL